MISNLSPIAATTSVQPCSPEQTAVKIDGLPPNISVSEIVQLFWGTPAKPGSTVVHKDPTKPHAHAFMDLGAPEHALHAMLMWNGTVMTTASGQFTLTVQLASNLEFKTAILKRTEKSAISFEDAILKVRGLPIKASLEDILAFFNGYKIKKQHATPASAANDVVAYSIHVQPVSGDNRHSKVAYVEFETPAEATRALEKNQTSFGKAFGERYCLLLKISKQEMMSEIARNMANTTTTGGSGPVYSNNNTSFPANSNASLDFTTSCASPTAFLNTMYPYHPGNPTAAAAAAAYMMPPPPGARPAHQLPLPFPQMPWGLPPAGYFQNFQMQVPYAGLMPQQQQQRQQQPFPANMAPEMWHYPYQPTPAIPVPQPQSAAAGTGARYLVQDLTTGQQVYLDPRFNLYNGGSTLPGAAVQPSHQPQKPVASASHQQQQVLNTSTAAAGRSVAVPSPPSHPGNEYSHHTTAEMQLLGEEVAADQGSNEGSDQAEGVDITAAEVAAVDGEKRSDQGSEDGGGGGGGGGVDAEVSDRHNEGSRGHHHHHHAGTTNINKAGGGGGGGGGGSAQAVIMPPPHHTVGARAAAAGGSRDGHKRLSMELNLPGDDRPVKHAHPEGR